MLTTARTWIQDRAIVPAVIALGFVIALTSASVLTSALMGHPHV